MQRDLAQSKYRHRRRDLEQSCAFRFVSRRQKNNRAIFSLNKAVHDKIDCEFGQMEEEDEMIVDATTAVSDGDGLKTGPAYIYGAAVVLNVHDERGEICEERTPEHHQPFQTPAL